MSSTEVHQLIQRQKILCHETVDEVCEVFPEFFKLRLLLIFSDNSFPSRTSGSERSLVLIFFLFGFCFRALKLGQELIYVLCCACQTTFQKKT